MKKLIGTLVGLVVVVTAMACASFPPTSGGDGSKYAQTVEGVLVAIPIKVADLPEFLKTTGWPLMIEGNALDMSKESRQKLGIIVCADGMDLSRMKPKFWNESGPIDQPAAETVVFAIFWLDPKHEGN